MIADLLKPAGFYKLSHEGFLTLNYNHYYFIF